MSSNARGILNSLVDKSGSIDNEDKTLNKVSTFLHSKDMGVTHSSFKQLTDKVKHSDQNLPDYIFEYPGIPKNGQNRVVHTIAVVLIFRDNLRSVLSGVIPSL